MMHLMKVFNEPNRSAVTIFLPDEGLIFYCWSTPGTEIIPAMESILENNYETEINDYGTMLTVEKLPLHPEN